MGSCNSYTPASFNKDAVSIDLSKFNRIIDFDKDKKLITVESGIKISELCNFLLLHDLWIPQIPGYPSVTLGGIVATNSHGKSCSFHGTIKRQIKKIKIFHKVHGWINLSEKENKEIFELTIGGFGLTGTIVEIQLKLENFLGNSFITKIFETNSTKDTIKKIDLNKEREIYYYSWNRSDNFKNFGQGFVFQNEINSNSKNEIRKVIEYKTKNIKKTFFFSFWNKFTINLSQSIYYNFYKYFKPKKYIENFESVIFPFIGKEFYFTFFGKKGLLESQIIVPYEKVNFFINEVEKIYKKYKPSITLFSLKSFRGEKKFLRFEDNGVCFTFDLVNNSSNIKFLNELHKLYEVYHLTPSIIKDSRLNLKTVKKCYEEYDKFREGILYFDKKRIYKSALSDKLNI